MMMMHHFGKLQVSLELLGIKVQTTIKLVLEREVNIFNNNCFQEFSPEIDGKSQISMI